LLLQHKLQPRMHKTKGSFTLKRAVNLPVRISALRQWLAKQTLVQVCAPAVRERANVVFCVF